MGVGVKTLEIYVSVEFEVVGQVQGGWMWGIEKNLLQMWILPNSIGCGFTKHCRDNCIAKGITGWVKNSKAGSIQGKMQGPKAAIDTMWVGIFQSASYYIIKVVFQFGGIAFCSLKTQFIDGAKYVLANKSF